MHELTVFVSRILNRRFDGCRWPEITRSNWDSWKEEHRFGRCEASVASSQCADLFDSPIATGMLSRFFKVFESLLCSLTFFLAFERWSLKWRKVKTHNPSLPLHLKRKDVLSYRLKKAVLLFLDSKFINPQPLMVVRCKSSKFWHLWSADLHWSLISKL